MPDHNREDGFALLDALLALAVFAMITGMFFQVVSSTMMTRRTLAERRAAVLVARSALTQLQEPRMSDQLKPGGVSGAFRWRASVRTYGDRALANSVPLERISVTVSRRSDDQTLLSLDTLRLSRP